MDIAKLRYIHEKVLTAEEWIDETHSLNTGLYELFLEKLWSILFHKFSLLQVDEFNIIYSEQGISDDEYCWRYIYPENYVFYHKLLSACAINDGECVQYISISDIVNEAGSTADYSRLVETAFQDFLPDNFYIQRPDMVSELGKLILKKDNVSELYLLCRKSALFAGCAFVMDAYADDELYRLSHTFSHPLRASYALHWHFILDGLFYCIDVMGCDYEDSYFVTSESIRPSVFTAYLLADKLCSKRNSSFQILNETRINDEKYF